MHKDFNDKRYSQEFKHAKTDIARIEAFKTLVGFNKHVLDVGCWDGSISEIIKKQNNEVEGVELSESAKLAEKKGINTYRLDLNSDWGKQIEKRYDVVLAGEIIEHVFDTDKFLQNIRNVLRDNGEVIVSTPNVVSLGRRLLFLFGSNPNLEYTSRPHNSGHIRYFTLSNLTSLLEENGFEILYKGATLVNLSLSGNLSSTLLAKILPTLGTSLVVKARKK